MHRIILAVLVCCWTLGQSLSAQPIAEDEMLRDAILPRVTAHRGNVAVTIVHLDSKSSFRYHSDRPMPTASLIKLPLMIAVYDCAKRGEVDLEKQIVLSEDDKVPGSGILTDHFSSGAQFSLRDYVRLMIRESDNTATNIVIEQVGLPATSKFMQSLGLDNTQLHSKVYRRDTSIAPERSQQFGIGSTTTDEMVTLLTRLYRGELADEHNTDAMLKHLLACNDQTKLARELPTNTELFHKTGAIGNCRTDAGIILTATGPVAVCVLTNKNVDQRWTNDNEAELLCSAIGRVIIDRFGKEPDSTGLRRGASGVMVENLQRTLNHRMKLDPGLSVDGDFGPATETAVKQFQVSQGIAPSGILDTATWKALETLVEEESITEDPVQFNARVAKLPKQVPPALTDPPIVTCKSWLIADGITGAELWSYKAHERRPPASTTKMMTAHIVLQLMAEKPEIGNEVVMISSKADQTIGSSSGLRAGEQVTVMELLYGLLLPSGNDAATAIAEHFGERLKTKLSSAAASPTEAFVSYMNQTAHSLGMDSTQFRNPHGLNDPDHWTTAKDLVRLAHVAMQNPSFQQIVSTRQHACAVESQEGYRRVVVWRNTNQLLELEGFSGVKTGTTEAAGACLVSTGVQDGKSRIIVILGSSDSQTRYADTRNLFRWSLTANN